MPDVLGSTANYLHKWNMEAGPALGLRSHGAERFRLHAQPRHVRRMAEARRAPRRRQAVSGRPATASCSSRAAPTGPAFIVTENFAVLKEYNNSDAYAIAVGHLADRIARRRRRSRPPGRPTTTSCRATRASRLQKKLSALGYKVQRLRRPHRFRSARQHPRRAEKVRHGAGRQSDGRASGKARDPRSANARKRAPLAHRALTF